MVVWGGILVNSSFFQRLFAVFLTLGLSSSVGLPLVVQASEPLAETVTLPEVVVVGTGPGESSEGDRFDARQIEALPRGDGSPNEVLTVLPGIQAGEFADSSVTGGEILPPNLSISGGRFYQNRFTIDGIGNDSILDPLAVDPSDRDNVPGHPQGLFLDTALIDTIEVHRSNVSARYGGFTGGVVDAQTRDPEPEFGGRLFVRTTRDAWTRFHIAEDDLDDFAGSRDEGRQPRFTKVHAGLELDLPLAEDKALLAAFSVLDSTIDLQHMGQERDQARRSGNLFLKYLDEEAAGGVLRLSYLSTPYTGRLFLKNTLDSDYRVEAGGHSLAAEWERRLAGADLELRAAWKRIVNRREADDTYLQWAITASKPWGGPIGDVSSREGGNGSLEKIQTDYELGADLTFDPVRTGSVVHELVAGAAFEHVTGTFDRPEALTRYVGAVSIDDDPALAALVCPPGDPVCVEGEQFLWSRQTFPEDSAQSLIRFYALYLEDTLSFDRFTVRPGVRLSYNDLMENLDAAPRLRGTWDLFGDGRTLFSAGVNRYYGKTFLAHALFSQQAPFYYERRPKSLAAYNTPQPWGAPNYTRLRTGFVSLDTPYADEAAVGVGQDLFGGRLELEYLKRRGRDELALQVDKDADNNTVRQWNNLGRTDHQEVTLSWERGWQDHYLMLNGTWQQTETGNVDFGDLFDEEALAERVWYDGRILHLWELPRSDFNRPWTANLIYEARLPRGLTFTNVTSCRSGYRSIEDTRDDTDDIGVVLPDGEVLDVYELVKNSEDWVFDWKLAWTRPLAQRQELVLTLEVHNVFNEKVPVGGTDEDFELGRHFWAGMEYSF